MSDLNTDDVQAAMRQVPERRAVWAWRRRLKMAKAGKRIRALIDSGKFKKTETLSMDDAYSGVSRWQWR